MFEPEGQSEKDSFDSYIYDSWQLDENAFILYMDQYGKMVKDASMLTNYSYPLNWENSELCR